MATARGSAAPKRREPGLVQPVDDRLDVEQQRLQRVVGHRVFGEPGTAHVVADEQPFLGQALVPAAALGDLPQLHVTPRPPGQVDQGRASTERPEGDALPQRPRGRTESGAPTGLFAYAGP